ncbi:S1 RNA-binding domain-containing protein [Hydrogenivirga sp. 128-5-R1-1]|uniref:S1 RNA-binding domain-containing protein n=1 Tax=Hydrogenivirga sp. 128-5-R1-1 TaxID=392423 RepID=UPI00015F17B6|nr:S1 RNA-binding domain-containing protein [Hydrogenivirga sp. 128-5-R1-1]EDP76137.1 ribosomal protein S01 [Hydrogenivirga sp. 128-5-R1-1]
MNEFEKLLSEALPQEESFKKGKIVTGRVIKIDDRYVYVDIGYKVEGVIPREEVGEDIKEGDEIQAVIVKISPRLDYPRLSYRIISQQKGLEELQKVHAEGRDVVGTVEKKTKGGFIVDIEGVKAFLPASEAGKKLSVGKPVRVKVIEISLQKDRPRVIVSHRAYLEEEREKRKQELLKKLDRGDVVEGRVVKIDPNKGITLIVEGVVRAFLPKEELSWGRDKNPFNYAEVDETIKVKVKKKSKDKDFLIVSLRELKENPWDKFTREHKVGDVIEAKVLQVVPKGVVLDLEEGLEGFVPLEEVSWNGDVPEKGTSVKAKVLRIEPKRKRVILSIRQALPKPWEEFLEKNPVGSKITAKVEKIEGSRAIVDLGDEKVKGVVHRSDLSWTKPKRVEEVLQEGEEREFVVLGTEGKYIKLGVKQLTPNPWEIIQEKYSVGDVLTLPSKEVMPFGAFLELPEGVEGLLPFSEVPKDVKLEPGQEYEVKIIDLNPKEGKITFSIKALRGEEEKSEEATSYEEEVSTAGFKLGDILKKKWKM